MRLKCVSQNIFILLSSPSGGGGGGRAKLIPYKVGRAKANSAKLIPSQLSDKNITVNLSNFSKFKFIYVYIMHINFFWLQSIRRNPMRSIYKKYDVGFGT